MNGLAAVVGMTVACFTSQALAEAEGLQGESRHEARSRGEKAADRLAWEMQSWKSIEVRTRQSLTNDEAGRDPTLYAKAEFRYRYIETASGRRLYEQHLIPVGAREEHWTFYCNGRESADETLRENEPVAPRWVYIKSRFGSEGNGRYHLCPQPLLYFYLGNRPLYEALKRASHLGSRRLLDRDCDDFLVTREDWGGDSLGVVTLDVGSSIPLEVRSFADERARAENRPSIVWTATAVKKVEGHDFPMESEELSYSRGASPSKVAMRTTTMVEEVHFNREYPETMFWPRIDAKTQVLDGIRKTSSGPKAAREAVASVGGALGETPIRAEPEVPWTDHASPAFLIVGLGVLSAGAFAWWRSR